MVVKEVQWLLESHSGPWWLEHCRLVLHANVTPRTGLEDHHLLPGIIVSTEEEEAEEEEEVVGVVVVMIAGVSGTTTWVTPATTGVVTEAAIEGAMEATLRMIGGATEAFGASQGVVVCVCMWLVLEAISERSVVSRGFCGFWMVVFGVMVIL